MHEQDETPDVGDARDKRPPSLGLGRIIIALFWLLGAWIFVTAIVDLFHGQGKPWGPQIVALLAGVDYLVAATALTHNGKRMRQVGWVTIGLSIAVPIILWVAPSVWLNSTLRARRGPAWARTSTICRCLFPSLGSCGCGVRIRAGSCRSPNRSSARVRRGRGADHSLVPEVIARHEARRSNPTRASFLSAVSCLPAARRRPGSPADATPRTGRSMLNWPS